MYIGRYIPAVVLIVANFSLNVARVVVHEEASTNIFYNVVAFHWENELVRLQRLFMNRW